VKPTQSILILLSLLLIFSCDNPEEPVIEGCITDTACNYNADATKDDGSCLENDCAGECGGSAVEDCNNVCGGESSNDDCGLCTGGSTDLEPNYTMGCDNVCFSGLVLDDCDVCNGNGIADGACDCDGNVLDECGICNGDGIGSHACDCDGNVEDCDSVCGGSAVVDECGICNGNGIADGDCDCDGNGIDDGECDCDGNVLDECDVCGGDNSTCSGCTYETACNYNPNATIGDGSCIWTDGICEACVDGGIVDNDIDDDGVCDTDEILGCMDETACNYDYTSTDDDGSCDFGTECCDGILECNTTNCALDTDSDGVCNTDEIEGCTDETACNYNETATDSCFDYDGDDIPDCCTYTDSICETCEDGMIVDNDIDNDGICDGDETSGCIYETACNYNPNTTTDDGSCFWTDGICETCEDSMIVDNDIDNDGICDRICDIDGNCYQTIQIGDQLWMAENLKVTHYNNGEEITNITNDGEWYGLSTGAYGDYDNNPTNSETYGRLYNWYTVDDSRGLCMDGWHVPSDDEYKELEIFLGMSESEANDTGWRGTNEGSKLAGNADLWNSGNLENNSEFGTSGFSAFPAGYRRNSTATYDTMGYNGYFWSSSETSSNSAWNRELYYNTSYVYRSYYNKHYGFSVRCLGD